MKGTTGIMGRSHLGEPPVFVGDGGVTGCTGVFAVVTGGGGETSPAFTLLIFACASFLVLATSSW